MTTARTILQALPAIDEASPPLLRTADGGIWEDPSPEDLMTAAREGTPRLQVRSFRFIATSEHEFYIASAYLFDHERMLRLLRRHGKWATGDEPDMVLGQVDYRGGAWLLEVDDMCWPGLYTRDREVIARVTAEGWTWVNDYVRGVGTAIQQDMQDVLQEGS